jgi:protease I
MAHDLQGRTIAFLVANEGVEQAELTSPWEAVQSAGGQPVLVAVAPGEVRGFHHLDPADGFPVDRTTSQVKVEDFTGLMLPGGVANADRLRTDEAAVRLVADFFDTGRPVAVICHGPWAIVEADRVRGRTMTSWPSLRTDIRNAGGSWIDAEVQVCDAGSNVTVSSRKPDDLPAFNRAMTEVFSEWRGAGDADRRSGARSPVGS